MMDTLYHTTSNRVRAMVMKSKQQKAMSSRRVSFKEQFSMKLQSGLQTYFVSNRFTFYGEMVFLRSKL